MTLKEQILQELSEQDRIDQEEMKQSKDYIGGESMAMSSLRGSLSGTGRTLCRSRMEREQTVLDRLKKENAWISEMLSMYR